MPLIGTYHFVPFSVAELYNNASKADGESLSDLSIIRYSRPEEVDSDVVLESSDDEDDAEYIQDEGAGTNGWGYGTFENAARDDEAGLVDLNDNADPTVVGDDACLVDAVCDDALPLDDEDGGFGGEVGKNGPDFDDNIEPLRSQENHPPVEEPTRKTSAQKTTDVRVTSAKIFGSECYMFSHLYN